MAINSVNGPLFMHSIHVLQTDRSQTDRKVISIAERYVTLVKNENSMNQAIFIVKLHTTKTLSIVKQLLHNNTTRTASTDFKLRVNTEDIGKPFFTLSTNAKC